MPATHTASATRARRPTRASAALPFSADARTARGLANATPAAAFLFDVDGVIADTHPLHVSAWRRMAEEAALPFPEPMADHLRGLSRDHSLRLILSGRTVSPASSAALVERKNLYYQQAVRMLDRTAVRPGVRRLFEELASRGVRIAAVSASRNARLVLDRLELTPVFDAIVDGEDERSSPLQLHRFLLAARAIRVEPARCVVVEDSAGGIEAARRFGMRVIGLGDPARVGRADLVLDSLDGVPADALLDLPGRESAVSSIATASPAPEPTFDLFRR